MSIKLTKDQLRKAIESMVDEKCDGTWHCKIGQYKERNVAIVLGWSCDYDVASQPVAHYLRKFGKTWTLCAKIAINIDDLQCDFDYDWAMPQYGDGDVYDTEHAVVADADAELAYLKDEAEWVLQGLRNGELTLEI